MTAVGTNRPHPFEAAARALGVSNGQLSTTIVAVTLAGVLTVGGLVPVLRERGPVPGATRTATPAVSAPDDAAGTTGTVPHEDRSEARGGDAAGGDELGVGDRSGSPPRGVPGAESRQPRSASGSAPGDPPEGPTDGGSSDEPRSTEHPTAPPTGSATVFAPVDAGAPDGLTVAPDGTVWVATGRGDDAGASSILAFSARGELVQRFRVSGQADDRPALGLTALTLAGDGALVALDASTARVIRVDPVTGSQRTLATLPDLPPCQLVVAAENGCEPGVDDEPPLPRGVAVDPAGTLYVTDTTQGTIWRIEPGGGPPAAFLSDTAFGSSDGLGDIAVAGDGSLVVASPQAIDPESAGGGAVYRVPRTDGGPGDKEVLARFLPGESPTGLALLEDGSTVVTLRDADAVVLLDPHGSEVRRVRGAAGDRTVDTPAGAAFHGSTLLVANRAPTSPADRAVLAVGIR